MQLKLISFGLKHLNSSIPFGSKLLKIRNLLDLELVLEQMKITLEVVIILQNLRQVRVSIIFELVTNHSSVLAQEYNLILLLSPIPCLSRISFNMLSNNLVILFQLKILKLWLYIIYFYKQRFILFFNSSPNLT